MPLASATAEDNALAGLITDAAYFGLNSTTPGTTGATEITGGSPAYTRVPITWGTPSGGTVANVSGALTLNVPASTTVAYGSTWGAVSGGGGGGYQIGMALSASVTFGTQGTLTVAVGGLTLNAN